MNNEFEWSYSAVSVLTLHSGLSGEAGPLYTRLLATAPDGPNHGNIFLTAEVYRNVGSHGPVFPIWKSSDNGQNWVRIADVADVRFGFGNRYQPMLYELPRGIGNYPRGTLLLAGNAIPADLSSTHLVLYASVNAGIDWEFLSDIDAGGPAVYDPAANATTTAVWEPNLCLVGDGLVCFYADERYKDQKMLQTLVHRVTRDLTTWSEAELDFGVVDRSSRPGMFVTTGELPDGSYRAAFEVVGPPLVPVHFTSSNDGVRWGKSSNLGSPLISDSGTRLSGSPNISWRLSNDGQIEFLVTGRISIEPDGTVSNNALFSANAGHGEWKTIALPLQVPREINNDNSGYSQSLIWAPDGSLVQATTVRNYSGSHDIVVARALPRRTESEKY